MLDDAKPKFLGLIQDADAIHGRWTEKSAVRTPRGHLQWVWEEFRSGRKWRKQISRYVQQADWISLHWRE